MIRTRDLPGVSIHAKAIPTGQEVISTPRSMLNDLRKRIGLAWVALRNGTDPSHHLNPITLRKNLISAYLTGVAKAYDQHRRNISSTERAYGKREFLRDIHAPPIDLATTVDETLSTLVSRGESVPTKSEVLALCQPLRQYMLREQRRLMRLGYEDGCSKLGVTDMKWQTLVTHGGQGSGNFGHAGRPGKRGGSASTKRDEDGTEISGEGRISSSTMGGHPTGDAGVRGHMPSRGTSDSGREESQQSSKSNTISAVDGREQRSEGGRGDSTEPMGESEEELKKKLLASMHRIADVLSGKVSVGVEGRGGKDVEQAKAAGLYTRKVNGTGIFARDEESAQPLIKYLEAGGKYGTTEFSRLLGYTEEEIETYKRYLLVSGQEHLISNEFNPNQPRDELGKWTGTGTHGTITRHQGLDNVTRKLFNRAVTDKELAAIGFSPEGVNTEVFGSGSNLYINTESNTKVMSKGKHIPELSCSRRISKGWFAPLTCYNQTIEIPKEGKYGGKGFDLFYDQVKTLKRLGVKRIVATAAGDSANPDGAGGVGYYVWPRMGYSGIMSRSQIAKLPEEIRTALKGKRDIRDLFDLGKAGRDAWLKHGSSIKVHFDLSDGSRNMRALEAYKQERSKQLTANSEVPSEELVTINDG